MSQFSEALEAIIKDSGLLVNKTSRSWILNCPKCSRPKLYFLKEKPKFVCWRCADIHGFRGRSEHALAEITGQTLDALRQKLYGTDTPHVGQLDLSWGDEGEADFEEDGEVVQEITPFFWPHNFHPIEHEWSRKGVAYLESRGIPLDIAVQYGIRYCPGKQAVVFPIQVGQYLLGWQERITIPTKYEVDGETIEIPKNHNPPGMPRGELIGFTDKIVGDWVVFCEGPITAMKSVDADTILFQCNGTEKKIKDFCPGDQVFGADDSGQIVKTEVVALHDHGMVEGFEVEFEDGYKIVCSKNHKFLTEFGQLPLYQIFQWDLGVYSALSQSIDKSLRDPIPDLDPNGSASKGLFDVPTITRKGGSGIEGTMENGESGLAQSGPGQSSQKLEKMASRSSRRDKKPTPRGHGEDANLEEVPSGRMSEKPENGLGCIFKAGDSGYLRGSTSLAKRKSRKSEKGERVGLSKRSEKVGRRSRKISRNPVQGPSFCQKPISLRTGSSRRGSPSMGRGSDSLRRGTKAGRFCFPRSQGLGGSRWSFSLSFSGIQKESSKKKERFGEDHAARRNVEKRMSETGGCNANSSFNEVFLQRRWQTNATGMERGAFAIAPLSSTGSLVLRRVVRVRSVGSRRMYDLEVAHSKHNFILPNGVVTSNSHLCGGNIWTGGSNWSDQQIQLLKNHGVRKIYNALDPDAYQSSNRLIRTWFNDFEFYDMVPPKGDLGDLDFDTVRQRFDSAPRIERHFRYSYFA